MAFSETEKKQRYKAIQEILKTNDLQALFLIGDTNVGHSIYGDFRYCTNNRVFFQRQTAVVFPGSEPMLFAYSGLFSGRAAQERSFISDIRISQGYTAYHGIDQLDPLVYDLVNVLKERGVSRGRVGTSFELFPLSWYTFLRKEMPDIELVDVHRAMMEIRFRRSQEEAEMFRRSAALADAGFEAALKMIRPGVTEYEIVAEIEYAGRKNGIEDFFTLIGSGTFVLGETKGLPMPVPPSDKRFEMGESVILEITPRYQGYWTQLVRIVNVGRPNPDLQKMQTVSREAIKKGLEQFKPGKRVMDVTAAMESSIAASGFIGKPPFGHICALDLVEERVTGQNDRVFEPGFSAILHPMVFTKDGKNVIFWGETYLATAEGYERLHKAGDELVTL